MFLVCERLRLYVNVKILISILRATKTAQCHFAPSTDGACSRLKTACFLPILQAKSTSAIAALHTESSLHLFSRESDQVPTS